MKARVICIVYLFIATVVFSNNSVVDSLRNVYMEAVHDTTKVGVLTQWALIEYRMQPGTAIVLWKKAANYSDNIINESCDDELVGNAKKNLATVYNNIGFAYNRMEKRDSALNFYQKALEINELISDKRGIAQVKNNIGNLYDTQGNKEKALQFYFKALHIREEIDEKALVAASLNNIGAVYYNQGEINKALDYYQRTLDIREELDDKRGMAIILNNLAALFNHQGNIQEALEYHFRSILIREEIGDHRGVAVSLVNIGNIYYAQNQTEHARENYQKALEVFEKLGEDRHIALCYNHLGNVYNTNEELDKAEEYFIKALNISFEIDDNRGIVNSYASLGDIHYERKEFNEALEIYYKALKIAEQNDFKRNNAEILIKIARVYYDKLDYPKAKQYATLALKLSEEIGRPKNIENAANLLSEIYEQTYHYKDALSMHKLYISMRDSVINEENRESTIRMQMMYEYQKKAIADSIQRAEEKKLAEAELFAKEEQLKREATQRYALYGGLLAFMSFGIVMFRNYRQKQVANILLSEQNSQILQNNEEITSQRDEIEAQRDMVIKQKQRIERQNLSITDSINYAQRIQHALLPDLSVFYEENVQIEGVKDSFVLYKPKEIVSGDFYWASRIGHNLIVAVADCTGHGVPGAFMSMLGISFLNEIVNKQENFVANKILNQLRDNVRLTLRQATTEAVDTPMDGMNIVIIVIDLKKKEMQYSGSYNPLYFIRNNELSVFKTDRTTIGMFTRKTKDFTNNTINLHKNDVLYMFSDGYVDQFDENGKKKFTSARFRNILLEVHPKPMEEQKSILENAFEEWRGENEQVDDVTVMGIRI